MLMATWINYMKCKYLILSTFYENQLNQEQKKEASSYTPIIFIEYLLLHLIQVTSSWFRDQS